MPVQDGRSEHIYGKYAQVEVILHLVTELQKEVNRLKSIRVSEREVVC